MNEGVPGSANVKVGGVVLEMVVGDIVRQDGFAAIVNAANAELAPGGGVAGAIHHAAGPGLFQECEPLAPIEPGEAVMTAGHELPNRNVIHCLGPVYGRDTPSDDLLAACYRNALELADAQQVDSVAFPAISTGAFGYPMESAAEVALRTMKEVLPGLRNVRRVRFVLADGAALAAHASAAEVIFDETA
jgi:O-acetyl-ADP-ribose deacetylase